MANPNILWIQTDEQRPDSLGCYGSAWAKTPYLDRLARRGVVFQNCVCNSPVCVPSRATQLAGRYPLELGTLHNFVFEMDGVYPVGTRTFPEVLAQAGYATASIGKWHTPNHPTWQHNDSLVNLEEYSGYYALNEEYDEQRFHVLKRPGGTPIILAGTYPVAHGHPSQVITDRAIDWLRALPAEQPFLLRVSHNWPHTPVLAPPPFDALYDPDQLPIRYYDDAAYQGRAARDRRVADNMRMRDLSREQVRQVWKDYMGLVACVDHEVGRLLSALQALDLERNTIILFSSDHGKSLGEWGATEKGFFDSEVWRVPFILAGPGIERRGTVTDICELVDTGRTLLHLAGLEAPADYRGRDLLSDSAPEAVYAQIGNPDSQAPLFQRSMATRQPPGDIRGADARVWASLQAAGGAPRPRSQTMRAAIRTARYRMDVDWYREGARVPLTEADGNLFDLQADSGEVRNLWAAPEAQEIVRELWRRLEEWHAGLTPHPELFANGASSQRNSL